MKLEIHYLPSIEYFSLLIKNSGEIEFEINENYSKQSYRNRARILTANGPFDLIVPIIHNNGLKQLMKDVKINYDENWLKQHIGAISSAYSKSAFFDYFFPEILDIYNKKIKFLFDLNIEFIELFGRFLGTTIIFQLSEDFDISKEEKFYNLIHPKRPENWTNGKIVGDYQYFQCFGNEFSPNLSILDLLMNQGRDTLKILNNTKFRTK